MPAIRRENLASLVLDGLQHHLMDPALCEVLAEEYTRHVNQLHIHCNVSLEGYKAELERGDKETEKLIDAICGGVPAVNLKDRMWGLEHRKEELTQLFATTKEAPVYVHNNMGKRYRRKISDLIIALNSENERREAAEIIRGLVDKIVLTPDRDNAKGTNIDLHGALVGILSLASKSKKALNLSAEDLLQVELVAGARSQPFRTLVSAFVPIPG